LLRALVKPVGEGIALLYIKHRALESFADFRPPGLARALLGNGEFAISNNRQLRFRCRKCRRCLHRLRSPRR
jgi:hypothetical protein